MAKDLSKLNRGPQSKDALLIQTLTLAAASNAVTSAVIDLGPGEMRPAGIAVFVENTSDIPQAALDNTETLTIDILAGTTASPTVAVKSSIPYLTGNGSATPARQRKIIRLDPQTDRYIKIRVNSGVGTAATAEQVEVGLIFE